MSYKDIVENIQKHTDRKKKLAVQSHDKGLIEEIVSLISELIFRDTNVAETLYKNGERRCRIKDKKRKQ